MNLNLCLSQNTVNGSSMKTFKAYLLEDPVLTPENSNASLVIFDIDDTLLHTTAKIKVLKGNKVVRELSNQDFNNYELKDKESFDFGEFRNAALFNKESKPISNMIKKLKLIMNHTSNSKVIMLTARADFDDKHKFLKTFSDLGIDMSKVHVHRAGNVPGDDKPAEKKVVWVKRYLETKQYTHVRLYDDSMANLSAFLKVSKEYPDVDFGAFFVDESGNVKKITK